jgi:alpha,alpha-trehalase
VLEIARFWSSSATWNEGRARWEIRGVMGPDEYHEKYPDAEEGGLRNNAYTNIMAVWCLLRAMDVLQEVGEDRAAELRAQLRIDRQELERWDDITRRMFVPFHDGRVISQFEGYDALAEFDWEGYRKRYGNIERLDRILKAEHDTPDRYRLSKQADVTMLFFLFDHHQLGTLFARLGYDFDDDLVGRNILYYMKRTSHGSTLSKMVFASVIHELDAAEGYRLFLEALRSDVDDIQGGTTAEGIHLGAMAGTVAMMLHRYAGVKLGPDGVSFAPVMPHKLHHLHFRVCWRSRWLDVDLTRKRLRVTADRDHAATINIAVNGSWQELRSGSTLAIDIV